LGSIIAPADGFASASRPKGEAMKRREFLKAAGGGLAVSAVAAPAVAQSMPEIKWRITASWPKSLDTLYGGVEYFCKRIAEVTDNRFQIQAFAAGEIVPGLQVLDAIQIGTVEMGSTAMYYYWGKDAAMTFGTALPFGLNSRQMYGWLHHGGGNELLNEVLAKFNCIGFAAGNTGAQMGGWFRSEIKTPADLKGVKFRIGGFAGTILARIGVVPQQLAGGDIYPALEKGTIDAAEWVGPYDDEKLGFYKIAKYYYYPGWWEGCGQNHIIINLDKWNELPKSYQSAVIGACNDAWGWVIGRYDAGNPAALRRLIANGALLKQFPPDVMEACYKAATEIYAELSKTNPLFKKLYDSVVPFRNETSLMMQIAEGSYDNFIIRLRTRT
jgi:TRAP-type mannitol/chloroaromatic compound transport system substrate-binding protein